MRLLRTRAIQPKFRVNQPDDRFEREADRVAEQILRMPEPAVQRNRTIVDAGRSASLIGQQNAAKRERVKNEFNGADASPVFGRSEPGNFLCGLGPGQPLDAASEMLFITPYPHRGIQRSTDEPGKAAVPEATTTEPDPGQTETTPDTGPYTQSSGSMLELMVRKTPQEGEPGEAELTIRMDYLLVTAGTGELGTKLFDPVKFHDLYASGDTSIKMSRLPSKEAAGQQLSDQQIADSNTLDESGIPLFWNYYNCKITYDYTLTVDPDITLWDAMKWQIQNQQGSGIFYAPFEIEGLREEQDIGSGRAEFIKRKFKELKEAPPDSLESRNRRELKKEAENYYYDTLFRLTRSERLRYRYLFLNMVEDNPEIFVDKKIIVGPAYSQLGDDSETTEKLGALNSSIQEKQEISASENTLDISSSLRSLEILMQEMFELGKTFEHKSVGGVASINDPNIAVIDPETLRIDQSRFAWADMPPELRSSAEIYLQAILEVRSAWIPELLAHEAGHNAGEALHHANPDYRYEQEGLQSSEIGKVRPTEENTIAIINDPLNRKHMEIH